MRRLTQDEEQEILNGDAIFPKLIDFKLEMTDSEFTLYIEEVGRIYCKWRHTIFKDTGAGYFKLKPYQMKSIKKFAEFSYQNKIHPYSILKFLHEKAIDGKINAEAFFQPHYIVNVGVLQSALAFLTKNSKVENSYSKNSQVDVRGVLSKKFDMSTYDDRALNSIISVAKSLKSGQRVNCSDNIRQMAKEIISYV